MTRPNFSEGVVVALLAAVGGSALHTVWPLLVGRESAWYVVSTLLGLGYGLYLLQRSGRRTGRVTTLTAWLAIAALGLLWWPPLSLHLLLQLGLIWLVRSLYHRHGILDSLLDLGLNLLALLGAVWAWLHSGSAFLGIWTFFLIQAVFVAIPQRLSQPGAMRPKSKPERFQQAYENAQRAIQQLSNTQ